MFRKSSKSLALIFALTCTMNASANAQPINDAHVRMATQQIWEAQIRTHANTDPELSRLEQAMMQSKLNDDPAYSQLLGQYLELKVRRHPESAQRLQKVTPLMVRAEELEYGIRSDRAHGKADEAMKKQKELLEISRRLQER